MGNNERDHGLDSQSASLFCLACFERIANSVWVLKRFEPEYDAECLFRWSAAMFEMLIAGRAVIVSVRMVTGAPGGDGADVERRAES